MSLNLLLDSADPTIWRSFFQLGLFTGITTNPTLLKKAGQPCTVSNLKILAKEAEIIGCTELHLQAWGETLNDLTVCGLTLGEISTSKMQIYVKIPITKEGTIAAKELIKNDIPVTFTACYEVEQVLISAALGGSYVAPYIGRINDQGRDGQSELIYMNQVLKSLSSNCEILTASIREAKEINFLAANGISTFTINPLIVEQLFNIRATNEAADIFNTDTK